MRPYLRPISFLYEQVVGVKNFLYDKGVLAQNSVGVPVISIGNLTVGGTGKTPVTDFCLKSLVADGKKVAVISRSYKADAEAPSLVDTEHRYAARYYGDEPVLLAQTNPEVDVYVGPNKLETAQFAVRQEKYDVLIVDDGFQHRKLARDLNIVILDATEPLVNYAVVPEGRGRESFAGIQRADLLILTKCNLASEEYLHLLEKRVPEEKEVLHFGYSINQFNSAGSDIKLTKSQMIGKSFFLVSAIARPDVFEKMMGDIGSVSKKSLHFRDHHQYTNDDIKRIESEFTNSKADFLVTTEKDAVKLRSLMSEPSQLWIAKLEVAEVGQKGRLHAALSKIFS